MPTQSQHRVYIPTNARANQYILAEFVPDQQFYDCFTDTASCYDRLSRQLFALCDENDLHNVHLIANNKLPIVRFHEEAYCLETQKQILFFYNPRYHEAHSLFADPNVEADKIRILFLATGEDLRANAAAFHSRVGKVITGLKELLPNPEIEFKVRDHQHLTYDIFARAKGCNESYGYKLRDLAPRYQARNCLLPQEHKSLTYVTFNIPLTRAIKTQFLDAGTRDYSDLYKTLEDKFHTECGARGLIRTAMIANGKTPLVRHRKMDTAGSNCELEKLSFEPGNEETQNYSKWDAEKLVQTVSFIVVAGDKDKKDMGYGRFMNQVEGAVRGLAESLGIPPERQDVNLRFYQHVSYFR